MFLFILISTEKFYLLTLEITCGQLKAVKLCHDIEYFNTTVEEYKVIYTNETSDYITKDDFDSVYVILL